MQPLAFNTALADIRRDEQIDAVRPRARFPRVRRVRRASSGRPVRRVAGAR